MLGAARAAAEKKGLEDAQAAACERNFELVSTEVPNGTTKLCWRCPSGHEWQASLHSIVHIGSGCTKCRHKGEQAVREAFDEFFDAKFDKARPKWLMGKKGIPLELDGFNAQLGVAFEYQGQQHYMPVARFGGEAAHIAIKKRDQLKRDRCAEQGVILMEIPYIRRRKEKNPDAVTRAATLLILESRFGLKAGRRQVNQGWTTRP